MQTGAMKEDGFYFILQGVCGLPFRDHYSSDPLRSNHHYLWFSFSSLLCVFQVLLGSWGEVQNIEWKMHGDSCCSIIVVIKKPKYGISKCWHLVVYSETNFFCCCTVDLWGQCNHLSWCTIYVDYVMLHWSMPQFLSVQQAWRRQQTLHFEYGEWWTGSLEVL